MTAVVGLTRVLGATALCLVVHSGCLEVDGGAVELSWKLRPASSDLEDKFVNCNSGQDGTGPVTHIRLDWEVRDRVASAMWPCSDNHGVTGFDLPAGQALLWVTPMCGEAAAAPETYTAPAPAQRNVILGDTVSLGAVELVLQVSSCDQQPCICQ